jgi:blocked-early-in-transport protein 1
MSDAYERERQNNSRLSELSAKVTALRGVTVDIYDNARAQDVIDNTVCLPLPFIPRWRSACTESRADGAFARPIPSPP